jgi:hypothetical protein
MNRFLKPEEEIFHMAQGLQGYQGYLLHKWTGSMGHKIIILKNTAHGKMWKMKSFVYMTSIIALGR